MPRISQGLAKRRAPAGFSWCGTWLLLSRLALAANVDFHQFSDPPGIVSNLGEAALSAWTNTLAAPMTVAEWRFHGWYDQYAARYSNANGSAQNPAPVFMLEGMVMTARYAQGAADSDADGVADWYELYHYGATSLAADADTDSDGYNLLEEYYRNYDPHTADAPAAWRYREQAQPGHLWATSEVYFAAQPTSRVSRAGSGETNGYRFCQWTLNGVRQADALGRALDPVTVAITEPVRGYELVAQYLPRTNDTDADGVADWFEWHYAGSLTQTGTNDADGDGLDLAAECALDTHPALADEVAARALAGNRSASFSFVYAADYTFNEASIPAGYVSNRWIFTDGSVVTGSTAALEYGNYRFCCWAIDGAAQTNANGSAVNPVVFVLTNNTTVTAQLLPSGQDADADGVADWYEWYHYGATSLAPDADTDSDGYSLLEEYYRNYDPHTADAPASWRYREQARPGHLWATSEVFYAAQPTSRVTRAGYGETNGYRFCQWTLNGVRQADSLGRALDPVAVAIAEPVRGYELVAQYLPRTNDTDADGVADWYEWHYAGSLTQTGTNDADGDGLDLAAECALDTHPALADEVTARTLAGNRSASFSFVYAADYTFNEASIPAGYVSNRWIFTDGSVVTGSTAALEYGNYRFCCWAIDGAAQTNANGSAVNPVVFVLTNNTTVTAQLLPGSQDADADGVADWYELYHYGATSLAPDADTDSDGYNLLEEYYRNYDPHTADAPAAWRYREQAQPGHLWATSEVYFAAQPTSRVSRAGSGETNGYRFCQWTLNGVRQADVLGRALDPVTVAIAEPVRGYELVAQYLPRTNDADADGVADWYEWHYAGSLTQAGTNDADGDGLDLAAECALDTHPALADEVMARTLAGNRSASFSFWQRDYFNMDQSLLVEGVATNFFHADLDFSIVSGRAFGGNACPALGDWDGDGDLDMFVGSATGRMTVYENRGTPTVMNLYDKTGHFAALAAAWAGRTNPCPCLGDWNGDRAADLVLGGDLASVAIISSTTNFVAPQAPAVSYELALDVAPVRPALLDVSGDHRADLLVLKPDGLVGVYTNTGCATNPFVPPEHTANLLGVAVNNGTGLTVADVNGDGLPDLLASDAGGRIWEFWQTNGGFQLMSKVYGGTYDGFAGRLAVSAGDLDGDGDTDVVAGFAEGGLMLLRNPDAHLRVSPNLATVWVGQTQQFAVVDGGAGAVAWRLAQNHSGGSVTNGLYLSGATAGVDVVEAAAGSRYGWAHVNVLAANAGRDQRAVVLAGRKSAQDPLWPVTDYLAGFAYNSLRYLGFPRTTLQYLSPDPHQDEDGNGELDDIDLASTWTNVCLTFTNWANGADELFVYMVDHGRAGSGDGRFYLQEGEELSGTHLDQWLDQFQDTYQADVTLVLDFCNAGVMAEALSYTGVARRTVLAACATNEVTYFMAGGLVSFSDALFSGLLLGLDLADSFGLARDAMAGYQQAGLYGGSGVGVHAGAGLVMGRDIPAIGAVCGHQALSGASAAQLWADPVSGAHAIERVWCLVLAPGYQPDPGNPVLDVPAVDLPRSGQTRRYEGAHDGFSANGTYKVAYYARDVWGSLSLPRQGYVTQSGYDERALLVLGSETNAVRRQMQEYIGWRAWETLQARQVARSNILCLARDGTLDLDRDGINDASGPCTRAALAAAFTNGLAGSDKATICLMGGMDGGAFRLGADETLAAPELAAWLNAYQAGGAHLAIVVLEFEGAGAFLGSLAPPAGGERIVMASTLQDRPNLWSMDGRMSFSYAFWSRVFNGATVGAAFDQAAAILRPLRHTACLDDNGNGTPNEKDADGALADTRYIGNAYMTGGDAPVIGAVQDHAVYTGATAQVWAAGVTDMDGVTNVWCAVAAPYCTGDDGLERVPLGWDAPNNRHAGACDGLTWTGRYTVTYFAEDLGGDAATPVQGVFELKVADADGDGLPDDWESRHFGGPTNATAAQDSDGDGYSNGAECRVGSDPTNRLAAFMLSRLAMDRLGRPVLQWPSAPNRTYSVYWTTNLLSEFAPLANGLGAAPGGVNLFTGQVMTVQDPAYFRIEAE